MCEREEGILGKVSAWRNGKYEGGMTIEGCEKGEAQG